MAASGSACESGRFKALIIKMVAVMASMNAISDMRSWQNVWKIGRRRAFASEISDVLMHWLYGVSGGAAKVSKLSDTCPKNWSLTVHLSKLMQESVPRLKSEAPHRCIFIDTMCITLFSFFLVNIFTGVKQRHC